MNLASLLARAIDTNGDAYLPFTLRGDFTPDEREVIETILRQHTPARVDAGFNNWEIVKYDGQPDFFYARRFTWDSGFSAETAQEMADKLAEYYAPKS